MKKFPKGFIFGAATSSHQVEGGCVNDWSVWEKENASRLANEYISIKDASIYPEFKKQGTERDNYISGKAVDHYNRYEEDFSLAESIGLNGYRFSIEWSRIEPEEGKWDSKEIEHYISMIDSLRSKGIEPFVTIWHWTLPVWLAETGGIMNKKFPFFFSRYASKIAESFDGKVRFYITINEPEIYSLNSYMLGKWPPQKKGLFSYIRAMKVLIKSHKEAYSAIKMINPDVLTGPSCNMTFFESGGGILNNVLVSAAEKIWNRYFIDHIKKQFDFIGLNYYFHNRIHYGLNRNLNEKISDMGWELYPSGIGRIIESLRKYRVPVYVTENGLADAYDSQRAWFIKETLNEIYNAICRGAYVRGYFHWSLLDNFEWDKGFWPEFGLISVNRKTMKRTLRPGAEIYRKIIKEGLDI